jgi:hypothetical protein
MHEDCNAIYRQSVLIVAEYFKRMVQEPDIHFHNEIPFMNEIRVSLFLSARNKQMASRTQEVCLKVKMTFPASKMGM